MRTYYYIWWLVVILIQIAIVGNIAIKGATPHLDIVLLSFLLFLPDEEIIWRAALFLGVIQDFFHPYRFGLVTVSLFLSTYAVRFLYQRFIHQSSKRYSLIYVALLSLLYDVVTSLMAGLNPSMLFPRFFGNMLYTVAVMAIVLGGAMLRTSALGVLTKIHLPER